MAFADPQSIVLPAPFSATVSLPRVDVGAGTSSYQSDDGTISLLASSQKTGKSRVRRTLRVEHEKYNASPLVPNTNVLNSMSLYIVFDIPVGGYSNAEALSVYSGFKGIMTANTDDVIKRLLGGQS